MAIRGRPPGDSPFNRQVRSVGPSTVTDVFLNGGPIVVFHAETSSGPAFSAIDPFTAVAAGTHPKIRGFLATCVARPGADIVTAEIEFAR